MQNRQQPGVAGGFYISRLTLLLLEVFQCSPELSGDRNEHERIATHRRCRSLRELSAGCWGDGRGTFRRSGCWVAVLPDSAADSRCSAGHRRAAGAETALSRDRKSTRLNSSHSQISYAV